MFLMVLWIPYTSPLIFPYAFQSSNIPSLAQLGFIVTGKIDKCTLYNAYVTQSDF